MFESDIFANFEKFKIRHYTSTGFDLKDNLVHNISFNTARTPHGAFMMPEHLIRAPPGENPQSRLTVSHAIGSKNWNRCWIGCAGIGRQSLDRF
jgi:hypothetical protein